MVKRAKFDRGKESYWRGKIGDHAASGLTISAYCRGAGISPNSFYRWRRVLAERDSDRQLEAIEARPPGPVPQGVFAPVSVRSYSKAPARTAPVEASSIDVVLSSGHVLRVSPGFDPDTLARLLGLLDSNSC